jgi:hypothetical protein
VCFLNAYTFVARDSLPVPRMPYLHAGEIIPIYFIVIIYVYSSHLTDLMEQCLSEG